MMIALLILAAFLAPAPARATKPCSPDTWYARQDRPSAEWARSAGWVAVAKLTAREENAVPFANCYLKDRSQCVMDDQSALVFKILRWEKGRKRGVKRLRLLKGYCAPPPPKEIGKTYRIYGREADAYIFLEKIAR